MEERACGVYDKKEIFCRESQGGRAGGREGGRQQAGMLVSSQAYGD